MIQLAHNKTGIHFLVKHQMLFDVFCMKEDMANNLQGIIPFLVSSISYKNFSWIKQLIDSSKKYFTSQILFFII